MAKKSKKCGISAHLAKKKKNVHNIKKSPPFKSTSASSDVKVKQIKKQIKKCKIYLNQRKIKTRSRRSNSPTTEIPPEDVHSIIKSEPGTSSTDQAIVKRRRSSSSSLKENDGKSVTEMLDDMLNRVEIKPKLEDALTPIEDDVIVLDDEEEEVIETIDEHYSGFFEDRTPATRTPRKSAIFNERVCVLEESDCVMLTDFFDVEDDSPTVTPIVENVDDSIIFVSEEKPRTAPTRKLSSPSTALDYIGLPPLSQQELTNLIRPKRTATKPQKQQQQTIVKEMPKTDSTYNTNLYNPDKDNLKKPGKRIIIVDGNNVAFGHGLSMFSSEGIKICVEYFQKMGHEIKIVVPQFRLQKASNPGIMENLHRSGVIVATPCKSLLNQKTKTSYDDRFVLQLASELDGVVISNDNYRDLMNECPEFKFVIENRVIGYTWCSNMFILPKDPYGRFGPKLDDILVRK